MMVLPRVDRLALQAPDCICYSVPGIDLVFVRNLAKIGWSGFIIPQFLTKLKPTVVSICGSPNIIQPYLHSTHFFVFVLIYRILALRFSYLASYILSFIFYLSLIYFNVLGSR